MDGSKQTIICEMYIKTKIDKRSHDEILVRCVHLSKAAINKTKYTKYWISLLNRQSRDIMSTRKKITEKRALHFLPAACLLISLNWRYGRLKAIKTHRIWKTQSWKWEPKQWWGEMEGAGRKEMRRRKKGKWVRRIRERKQEARGTEGDEGRRDRDTHRESKSSRGE